MTYKSHQEGLDGWTIEELCGHYVNYRKQVGPSSEKLPPEDDFQLYAVSTRYPEKLASQIELLPGGPGIYDVRWGIRNIRVMVLSRISPTERNAPWLMFSADSEKVKFGAAHYRWKRPASGIINKLFKKYKTEGVTIMPYTFEDYQREVKEEVLKSLTQEEIDQFLKGLKPEERLKGLPPEEIEEYLKRIRR
ncbi:MAG: hypothetical protein ACLFPR_15510 [Desulfococcaceae bacterium]